jgi:hypothetical protein
VVPREEEYPSGMFNNSAMLQAMQLSCASKAMLRLAGTISILSREEYQRK